MSKEVKRKPKKVHMPITGMTCSACAGTVEKGLAKIPGVKQARGKVPRLFLGWVQVPSAS